MTDQECNDPTNGEHWPDPGHKTAMEHFDEIDQRHKREQAALEEFDYNMSHPYGDGWIDVPFWFAWICWSSFVVLPIPAIVVAIAEDSLHISSIYPFVGVFLWSALAGIPLTVLSRKIQESKAQPVEPYDPEWGTQISKSGSDLRRTAKFASDIEQGRQAEPFALDHRLLGDFKPTERVSTRQPNMQMIERPIKDGWEFKISFKRKN